MVKLHRRGHRPAASQTVSPQGRRKRAAGASPAPLPPGRGRSWAKTQIQNREVSTMPQPKIYAAVLNHFGSLSDLAATLGATVVDETFCFSGLTGQAVSDLMGSTGLITTIPAPRRRPRKPANNPTTQNQGGKSHVRTAKPIDCRSGRDH